MKAVVAAFIQEKALVGAFSVITNLRMQLFETLVLLLTMESSTRSSSAHRRDEAGEQRPEVSRPGVRVLSSTASTLRRRRELGSISIVSGNRRKAADTCRSRWS